MKPFIIIFISLLSTSFANDKYVPAEFWLTSGDKCVLLKPQIWEQKEDLSNQPLKKSLNQITINSEEKFQSIDGFGFALTGGSAELIYQLPSKIKKEILDELFLKDTQDKKSLGINYLRISIGASDLSSKVFSYDDLEVGQTSDPELKHFSLSQDLNNLIPLLKKIIKINPKIKILASPWSAPSWMKTNKSFVAGKLDPIYYSNYAHYFVKYIKAMKAHGISIEAITIQNEPLNPNNNPSMIMEAKEELTFIKNYLGPLFKKELIKTKIIVWDHNCDLPEYPLTILKDPEAAKYIDGSAFHLYLGMPDALTKVHNAFPSKNVYMTEQWVGGPSDFNVDFIWHVKNMIIGSMRNWSKNVIEWNIAADTNYGPHTQGGCQNCLGALTIEIDSLGQLKSPILRNTSYYVIAHASKFIPPGAIRIASESTLATLSNVAFQTADGTIILIVLNEKNTEQEFQINFKDKIKNAILPARSVGTFTWSYDKYFLKLTKSF